MDATSREFFARQLVAIVWDHSNNSNDLEQNSREMYIDHDLPDNGVNFTTTGEVPEEATMSWWHTMAFILMFFFIILMTLIMRDGICSYCGITCCGSAGPLVSHSSQHPIPNREGLTPEQIKERQLEKQRQERRLWYSYYLKPYIAVLTEKHFMTDGHQVDQDQKGEEAPISDPEQDRLQPASGAMCMIEEEDDSETVPFEDVNINDEETKQEDSLLVCKPVGSQIYDDDEEFPTKLMTLWDPYDTTFRQMEANCSICLVDYEPGDTIVRSAADEPEEHCIHVFHLECMLLWLEHGRKRCPICRHWFVPAVRIKEQMKEAHLVTQESLRHLYDARTMQNIVSLCGDTDSSMSRSFSSDDTETDIEQGRPIEQAASSNTEEATPAENLQTHHHHHHHRRHSHPAPAPISSPSSPSSLREGGVFIDPESGVDLPSALDLLVPSPQYIRIAPDIG